jgi:hypothetical protein
MTEASLRLAAGRATRLVRLSDYLDAAAVEQSHVDANAWIKSLRRLEVNGMPLRRRFTFRGDSLWWFTELYLHKQQVIVGLHQAIAAIARLMAREAPSQIVIEQAPAVVQLVLQQLAARHGIEVAGAGTLRDWPLRLAKMRGRARWLHMGALASRIRTAAPPSPRQRRAVAAFVHRAFWRDRGDETTDEAYIGPVLQTLSRVAPGELAMVSLGPPENFAARRWWHPLRGERGSDTAPPIESFAPAAALVDSGGVWAARHANLKTLSTSPALRDASSIHDCDCWPVVREALAGVALLQWPWSARAMDEAAAALDHLQPDVALTYAEAGGWGRALMLECRRRRIPSVGLQHGFIYRHWLNYLHEPDEATADPAHPADHGFPFPTRTLLFDGYARHHLETAGNFPSAALQVTGSPRLDALVAAARDCTPDALSTIRERVGAAGRKLVLLVTKYKEAATQLNELLAAIASEPDVQLAIKTHPAETADLYERVPGANSTRVTILPASAALAPLIMASDALVTVNSTVALDAAVLGRPSLVIGLPNNLSPFVEAGLMAGAGSGEVRDALHRILYDQELRLQLETSRRSFLARYSIGSDGTAAARTAAAILQLSRKDLSG